MGINALKQHFNVLNKFRPKLGIVLHTFHRKEHLKKLFKGIDVKMDEWFDITMCFEHGIMKYIC